MSAEREFAAGFGGRLVAIEAVLFRLITRMPNGQAFIDEVETALDRVHADHLANIPEHDQAMFLDIMKAASAAIGKMRDQLRD